MLVFRGLLLASREVARLRRLRLRVRAHFESRGSLLNHIDPSIAIHCASASKSGRISRRFACAKVRLRPGPTLKTSSEHLPRFTLPNERNHRLPVPYKPDPAQSQRRNEQVHRQLRDVAQ